MQTHPGKFLSGNAGSPANFPNDSNVDPGFDPLLQYADHLFIRDLRVINEQLFLRPFEEAAQHLSRVCATHYKVVPACDIGTSRTIGFEELYRFLDQYFILGDNTESAAVFDIEVREVKRKHHQNPPINNEIFVVITDQIVGGARNRNSVFQKSLLELAQVFLAPTVHVGDQCRDLYTVSDGRF